MRCIPCWRPNSLDTICHCSHSCSSNLQYGRLTFQEIRLARQRVADGSRWHMWSSCLEEIQGVAAPADTGLPPLVRPEPDFGQEGITPDWVPGKPAGPQVQGRLILRKTWHV